MTVLVPAAEAPADADPGARSWCARRQDSLLSAWAALPLPRRAVPPVQVRRRAAVAPPARPGLQFFLGRRLRGWHGE